MRILTRVTAVVRQALAVRLRSRSQRLALAELMAINPARLDELGIDLIAVREAMRRPRPEANEAKRSPGVVPACVTSGDYA